ncbi:hypothetical protein H0H87_001100 [Tephrocybe sp. NHM501043]|nr:hypothetical protein H0H87_001100 [Tephrocybe sp. NHM501043]
MSVLAQASTTSLSRYNTAQGSAGDPQYGSTSRDFCNSFWGPGDDGVNILFSRMRGATKTTDELRQFWNERALIEEQYATRMAALAKSALGGEEIGELRNSLDTLRLETEKQSASHSSLAASIRSNLESQTSMMHAKQVNHRRNVQAAVEKKFKAKQTHESYVAKAKEKYDGDCKRIQTLSAQCASLQGKDLERAQLKLRRAQQTVQANEMDFSNFTQALLDMTPGWEADWKDFCDACQDLEEDRLEFMKDTLWAYANDISTVCVNDDSSCERIRQVLDNLEAERDVENFVVKYGTGNLISDPATFVPYDVHDGALPSEQVPITRPAQFNRISRRVVTHYTQYHGEGSQHLEDGSRHHGDGTHHHHENGHQSSPPESPGAQIWAQEPQPIRQPPVASQPHPQQLIYQARRSSHHNGPLGAPPNMDPPPAPSQTPLQRQHVPPPVSILTATAKPNRVSGPLPIPMSHNQPLEEQPPMPTPPPQTEPQETGAVLFYVKALYDYTASIEEEFDFQAGDVIAVTSTPDDGWWSGELLDEARREEGRHIFPSNFVCLF